MKKTIAVIAFLFFVALSVTFGQTTAREWYAKADEYYYKGDYANAIKAYNESIKLDNTYYYAYFHRSWAYEGLGDYNAVISDLSNCISLRPDSYIVYSHRGNAYFQIKNYDAAIADYNKAITLRSDSSTGYIGRGNAYYQLKKYDEAINDYNKAINLDSNPSSDVYIVRAKAYGAKGLYNKAIADYKTGLEKGIDPSNFTVDKTNKADMWFCGAMYMEIMVNRFLGKTDVVTKYENWLKTVSDKNKVTRPEIEAFYRDNVRALIASVVDEEFKGVTVPAARLVKIKKIISDFFFNPSRATLTAIVNEDFAIYLRNSISFANTVLEEGYADVVDKNTLNDWKKELKNLTGEDFDPTKEKETDDISENYRNVLLALSPTLVEWIDRD